ncbi:MAG: hypothetical protein HYY03_00500 [Chloroflexi bacterium]|nr:hypothetical protein [Chloroflexota bacterium]
MGSRVTLRIRQAPRVRETLIIRGDKVVTILPEGDPPRYLLQLPVERLNALRNHLAPLLERRPQVKEILDAIIEYKEEGAPGAPPPSAARWRPGTSPSGSSAADRPAEDRG